MSSPWRRAAPPSRTAYQALHQRISAFLALPLEDLSRDQILAAARRIHAGD